MSEAFSDLPTDVQAHLIDELTVYINTRSNCVMCKKSMHYAIAELKRIRLEKVRDEKSGRYFLEPVDDSPRDELRSNAR